MKTKNKAAGSAKEAAVAVAEAEQLIEEGSSLLNLSSFLGGRSSPEKKPY
jgi:hypothetical protein